MEKITSINNDFIKKCSKLKEKKYRDLERQYLVEGFHLVEMAKDDLECIFTTDIINIPSTLQNIKTFIVTNEIIKKLSCTKTPQPIIGLCKYKKQNFEIGKKILLLDNLQDPGNIGTIIRTSVAFNIDTVIISLNSSDIYNDKVIRASQGAIFVQNIIQTDLLSSIQIIKDKGIKVFGTSLLQATNLKDIKKVDSFAIVLGNEGNGVSQDILKLTDENIKIPINEKIESLNVGIAGAILMYYFS